MIVNTKSTILLLTYLNWIVRQLIKPLTLLREKKIPLRSLRRAYHKTSLAYIALVIKTK